MKFNKIANHTFVICAYKESQYLSECILSLKKQTLKSKIIMVTGTPNDYIKSLSIKYSIPLYINTGETGITQDWNYGLSKVTTKYATIAHQDDTYEPTYLENIAKAAGKRKNNIIIFSDYMELRNNERVYDTTLLRIKSLMLSPLRIKAFSDNISIRRLILSFGDPICCPAVTFCLHNVTQPIFSNHFTSCEDWEAWEKLSRLNGRFVYVPKRLMCHRIHEESTTTAIINDNKRSDENLEMYLKFWPKPIAKFINNFYAKAEDSNQL